MIVPGLTNTEQVRMYALWLANIQERNRNASISEIIKDATEYVKYIHEGPKEK